MQNDIQEEKELTLFVVTDIHYLSSALYDDGNAYHSLLKNNDGKLFEYDAAIMKQLVEAVLEEKPDALLLCGDLTFNGEMESLQELKTYLDRIMAAYIPVLVVPGNHDIAYPYAMAYLQDIAKSVPAISQQEFLEEMSVYGYDEAISVAPDSFSYVYPVSDTLRILALDANTESEPGRLSQDTLMWAKEQLEKAQADGVRVISMSHQNVLKQNALMFQGYVMNNYKEVSQMLEEYGVELNLSGHSHLQHISQENGLTDICNESLVVYPLSYGVVHIPSNGMKFSYERRTLGIYEEEAQIRFDETVSRMVTPILSERDIPEDIRQAMIDFALDFNRKFYSGQLENKEEMRENIGFSYWKQYAGDTFWYYYIQSAITD